jgi:hypothetical protein
MKTYEIKEMKKSVDYVDGKRVVEWVYMVTRDYTVYQTREDAKKHLTYLKSKQNRQWKAVTQAYMEDKIDWIIERDNEDYIATVTNLETNESSTRKLEGTKPHQRKEAVIQAFKELKIKK